jgi:hypothetical protein
MGNRGAWYQPNPGQDYWRCSRFRRQLDASHTTHAIRDLESCALAHPFCISFTLQRNFQLDGTYEDIYHGIIRGLTRMDSPRTLQWILLCYGHVVDIVIPVQHTLIRSAS